MGGNILDASAMEAVKDIDERVTILQREQSEGFHGLELSITALNGKMEALAKSVADEPLRCPMREKAVLVNGTVTDVSRLDERVGELEKDVREVKTTIKLTTGANAVYASFLTAATAFLAWLKGSS